MGQGSGKPPPYLCFMESSLESLDEMVVRISVIEPDLDYGFTAGSTLPMNLVGCEHSSDNKIGK